MGPPCSQLVPSHRGSTANKLYLRCIEVRQSLGKVCCRNFVFGCELTYDADLWGSCWHVWHQERHPGLDRHVTHSRSNLEGSWQWDEMPITTMRCDAFKSFSRLLFSLPNFRGQIAVAVASASRRNQASQGNSRAEGEHGQRFWFRSRTDCCLRLSMAGWQSACNACIPSTKRGVLSSYLLTVTAEWSGTPVHPSMCRSRSLCSKDIHWLNRMMQFIPSKAKTSMMTIWWPSNDNLMTIW